MIDFKEINKALDEVEKKIKANRVLVLELNRAHIELQQSARDLDETRKKYQS